MSRGNSKEDKLQESLQNQNRELKAENRRLHKIVKKLNRGYKRLVEEDTIEEKEIPKEVIKLCFECSGEYKLIEVAGRRFRLCQDCGKRGKVTIL